MQTLKLSVFAIYLLASTTLTFSGSPAQADDVRDGEWHLRALKISEVHQIATGVGITVAVVDTGVDPHPDLRRNVLRGTSVVKGDIGTGMVDEIGHGTAMAGLIAAHGRGRANGVLGIAPNVKILPVKESNERDQGNGITVAAGIEWASRNGASVINVSSVNGPSLTLKASIEVAAAHDAVVVAAAGNKPDFLQFGYPAAMPGVLAVGSSDNSGQHAKFSITGKPIQICAPGVDVMTARPGGKYSIAWGTSSSTAIVSGAAALVRAKFPELSAQQVIHRLTATATDIGPPGRDDQCGFGLLNIVKALTAAVPPMPGAVPASPPPTTEADAEARTEAAPSSSSHTTAIVGSVVAVLLSGGLLAVFLVRGRRRRRARHTAAERSPPARNL